MSDVPSMDSRRLDATFGALADPTRRAILARLALGEASVNELCEPFEMSQPAISKHLKVLENAGLISRHREAQKRPCRLEPEALAEADAWLESYREYWEANYQRLDALLETLQAERRAKPAQRGQAARSDRTPERRDTARSAPKAKPGKPARRAP